MRVVRTGLAFSVVAVLAASMLSGCAAGGAVGATAQASTAGNWQITRGVDRVTGGTLTKVSLSASRTANTRYSSTPNALLQFACLKGQLIPHFQFAFQVGSKADSEILYRFDDRSSHSIQGHILRGLKIVVIDDKRETGPFLAELEQSAVLYLIVNSLTQGRTAAEFPVAGASAALAAVRAVCH